MSKLELDAVDWRILAELQRDARLSSAALGRRVHLSAPAVAARVRRLEDGGVIVAYRVELNMRMLGFAVLAFVRVRPATGGERGLAEAVAAAPAVLECHHVTGDDCFIAKVAADSVEHLEGIVAELGRFGSTTTSIVFSTPVGGRVVDRPSRA